MSDVEVLNDAPTEIESSKSVESPVAAASTPEADQASAQVTDPAINPVAEPGTPPAPTYTPNFKFNVKGKEHEIDEMFRGLIKDAESEKKVKEVFEKSMGLDVVKQDRQAIKTEYEGFKTQIMPHLQTLHKFTSLRDGGNLGAAFQVAGITDDQIFEYALSRLEMEKNPHQAALFKQNNEAALKAIDHEAELNRLRAQTQSHELMTFNQQLDHSLASVKDLASMVDQRLSQDGAFREEVINLGVNQFNKGINLSVEDAVSMVANKYKSLINQSTNQQAPAAPAAPAAPQAHQRPHTIPNTGTSNVSPISKKVRSISDLKGAYKDLVASGQ